MKTVTHVCCAAALMLVCAFSSTSARADDQVRNMMPDSEDIIKSYIRRTFTNHTEIAQTRIPATPRRHLSLNSFHYGVDGPGRFRLWFDQSSSESSDTCITTSSSSYQTDDIFGAKFKVRAGRPVVETDPLRATDKSAVALDEAQREEILLTDDGRWTLSEKNGVCDHWKWGKHDCEVGCTKLTNIHFSLGF